MRPQMAHGIQSGDPKADGAIIWSRSDRPARMWVEWATTASFAGATRMRGPHMLEDTDFTGRVDLGKLPAGQEFFCRVVLQVTTSACCLATNAICACQRLRAPAVRDITWAVTPPAVGHQRSLGWHDLRTDAQGQPRLLSHCGTRYTLMDRFGPGRR